MKEIEKLKVLFLLKEIDRSFCPVKGREESTAEHTYSSLILAQYFLPKMKTKLNELKIMKMLLYHDIIEIESGDTYLYDDNLQKTKLKKEQDALNILVKKIPKELSRDFVKLWKEFEDYKTQEAKFCVAIDKLDPIIYNLYSKQAWKAGKISEKRLREKKEKYFIEFPVLLKVFNDIVEFVKHKKYFYGDK